MKVLKLSSSALAISVLFFLLLLKSCNTLKISGTLDRMCRDTFVEAFVLVLKDWPLEQLTTIARLLKSDYYDFQSIYDEIVEPETRQRQMLLLNVDAKTRGVLFSLRKLQKNYILRNKLLIGFTDQYFAVIPKRGFEATMFNFKQRLVIINTIKQHFPSNIAGSKWKVSLMHHLNADHKMSIAANAWPLIPYHQLSTVVSYFAFKLSLRETLESFAMELLKITLDGLIFSQIVRIILAFGSAERFRQEEAMLILLTTVLNNGLSMQLVTFEKDKNLKQLANTIANMKKERDHEKIILKEIRVERQIMEFETVINTTWEFLMLDYRNELLSNNQRAIIVDVLVDLILFFKAYWKKGSLLLKKVDWLLEHIDPSVTVLEKRKVLVGEITKRLVQNDKSYFSIHMEKWKESLQIDQLLIKHRKGSRMFLSLGQRFLNLPPIVVHDDDDGDSDQILDPSRLDQALRHQCSYGEIGINLKTMGYYRINSYFKEKTNHVGELMRQFVQFMNIVPNSLFSFDAKERQDQCWKLDLDIGHFCFLTRCLQWFFIMDMNTIDISEIMSLFPGPLALLNTDNDKGGENITTTATTIRIKNRHLQMLFSLAFERYICGWSKNGDGDKRSNKISILAGKMSKAVLLIFEHSIRDLGWPLVYNKLCKM